MPGNTCSALGKRNGKAAHEIFEQQAYLRYVNCLNRRDSGIDDVVCNLSSKGSWTQKEHVTNKLVAGDAFQKMEFSDRELADFGHYILTRFGAFIKRHEN